MTQRPRDRAAGGSLPADANRQAAARECVVIGAPTGAFAWSLDAITTLAKPVTDVALRPLDRTDALKPVAGKRNIYLSRVPGAAIIEAIASGALKPLLVVEDPVSGVEFQMRQEKRKLVEAIRAHTAAAVANPFIAAARDPLIVQSDPRFMAADWVRFLAEALALPSDAETVAGVLKALGTTTAARLEEAITRRYPAQAALRGEPSLLDDGARAQVRSVLEPMLAAAFRGHQRPVVWPTSAFLWGDRPNDPAPLVADLLGPARVIYYGPYYHLPPGLWSAELALEFGGLIEDLEFSLEVIAGDLLSRMIIGPRPSGRYLARFRFRHKDPVQPIEVRLRSERGAIDGTISLVELRLDRADG